jgi:hypothetical protein
MNCFWINMALRFWAKLAICSVFGLKSPYIFGDNFNPRPKGRGYSAKLSDR